MPLTPPPRKESDMRYLLFNWDTLNGSVDDPSNLSDEAFEGLAKLKGGVIYESSEDFESGFNAEHFSVHTHQLRIIPDKT